MAASTTGYQGHGAESVSPELLRRFAPKPLPHELSRKVQSMLDVRGPGAGLVLPGGKGLVFTWSVTGTNQVYRLDGPKRFPVQLTGGEDATWVTDVTPDGKTLIVRRDRKGEEYPGIYLQDVEGGPLRVVLHAPKVQARPHFISKDGKYLYYSANDKKPDSYAVYRHDLRAGKRKEIFAEDGLWSVDDGREGKLLLSKATGSLTREISELDLDTMKRTPLLGQGEKELYVVRYGPGGDLYVVTNKTSEFRRLHRARREGDKMGPLVPVSPDVPADVESLSIDEARTVVLYTLNEGGYTRLRVMDARTAKELPAPAMKDAVHVRVADVSRDGRFATLLARTEIAPAIPYVYDVRARKLVEWAIPSAPEIDTSTFVSATLEHFVARDGTKIPMFVRRPRACAAIDPCPVVVHFHGGPEGQSLPGFSAWAQLFVDAGFVWVDPNVRGSDGYGKTWLAADDGERRLAIITDIEDASKHVRTAFSRAGRPPKVGVLGGSYGGYSALMAMTRFAGAYDAGVSIVGIANLHTFLANTAPYRRSLRTSEYGDPDKDREALLELSPTTYVDRVKGPLLLIQGATDPRVPAGEAISMYEALAAKKIPSGLILFADEGHGTQKRENRVLQIGHALAFLKDNLK